MGTTKKINSTKKTAGGSPRPATKKPAQKKTATAHRPVCNCNRAVLMEIAEDMEADSIGLTDSPWAGRENPDAAGLPENPPRPVAVVVGASSGIGYHTGVALSKEGFTVYNLSRTDSEPFHIRNIHADATVGDQIQKAVQKVLDKEGHIDVLVYSAGWSLACPLEYTSEEDFRKIFEVNYFGMIKALWAVIPHMRERRGGRIIAISSMAGSMPIPFDAPYSASKAALDMTLRALNIELKPFNVKLTSILPGGVNTHFTYKRKVYPTEDVGEYADSMRKAVKKLAHMERQGMDPRDVADTVVTVLGYNNPPETTAVGIANKSARFAYKILPTALNDLLNRMAYDQ